MFFWEYAGSAEAVKESEATKARMSDECIVRVE
jgi:hypothetical protein